MVMLGFDFSTVPATPPEKEHDLMTHKMKPCQQSMKLSMVWNKTQFYVSFRHKIKLHYKMN